MMSNPTPESRSLRPDVGVWMALGAAALAIGLITHGLFPRYELTPLGADSVVILDRWTGAFQRAAYGPDGEPRATAVVRPF